MGALPTGDSSSEFDLGDFGTVGAGLSALAGRNQTAVMDALRAQLQSNGAWSAASDGLFGGLFPDGETPFPVLFLSAIIEQIFRDVPNGSSVINLLVELGDFFEELWDILAGGTASGDYSILENIWNFILGLPIVGDLVEAITGIEDGDLDDLGTYFNNWIDRFLGRGELIPVSHLVDDYFPNILSRNRFSTAEDILPPNTWDGAVGFSTPGSLRMTANGSRRVWDSVEGIGVTAGRQVELSARVAAQGLVTGGGEPAFLAVVTYLNGNVVGEEIIDTVLPPSSPAEPEGLVLPTTLPAAFGAVGTLLPATLPVSFSTPGFTPVPDLDWVLLSGTYTAPAGVDQVRLRLGIETTALTGTVWFDELEGFRTGLIEQLWVNGLPDKLVNLTAEGLFNAEKLQGIVTAQVEEVHETWDRFWANVYGDNGTNVLGIQGFINAVRSLSISTSNSAEQARTAIGMFNFGASQSIWGAANPTFETTVPLGSLRKPAVSGSTVTTSNDPWSTTVTQTSSAMGFVRCKQSQDKTVVQWLGLGRTSITTCKLHIYRMNVTTGVLTWIQTENIVAAGLPNTTYDFVNVPLTTPVHVEQGDVLGLEVCITGAGTHTMAGLDTPWLPNDLTARPKRPGATRNSGTESAAPTTIADASVGYDSECPYIGAGVLLSSLPTPKYTYSETFDGDTSQWTAVTGGLLFNGGLFKTATASHNATRFNSPTYGDESRIEFDYIATWDPLFGGFGDGDHIRLFGWANDALTQYVAVDIASHLTFFDQLAPHTVSIATGTSPTTVVTRTGGVSFGRFYSGRVSLEYDPGTNTYGVFLGTDPTPVLTWTDSTHLIQHGPGFRKSGIYANLTGTGLNVCDNFSYRDL